MPFLVPRENLYCSEVDLPLPALTHTDQPGPALNPCRSKLHLSAGFSALSQEPLLFLSLLDAKGSLWVVDCTTSTHANSLATCLHTVETITISRSSTKIITVFFLIKQTPLLRQMNHQLLLIHQR